MSWRVAESLEVLLAEVNAWAPNRSKASDGSIGDAAHASRTSDHNPWVKDARGVGVVRARDFTHDPEGGLDAAGIAAVVAYRLGKHPALGAGAYVIWRRRIISANRLAEGWRPYAGANPHDKHVHVSVGTSGYDARDPWHIFKESDPMADYAKQLDRIEEKIDTGLRRDTDRFRRLRARVNQIAKATRNRDAELADQLEAALEEVDQ